MKPAYLKFKAQTKKTLKAAKGLRVSQNLRNRNLKDAAMEEAHHISRLLKLGMNRK
jgi:hypothetical protein